MNTNRLSQTMETALNAQITKEAQASQTYLSYAAWADSQGLAGVANFLFRHADEEHDHMLKVMEYILKRGGEVKLTAIPGPSNHPENLNNCFEKVFKHEVDNTKAIYSLVQMSLNEEDWATWNFLQWFVKEQIEEEMFAMNLLNKIKISGGVDISNDTLYTLDRDLETTPDDAKSALGISTGTS